MIDKTTRSSEIVSITLPNIVLDKIEINDIESESALKDGYRNDIMAPTEFVGDFIPIVVVNKYELLPFTLKGFSLYNTGKIPTIAIHLIDVNSDFSNRFYPRDGDIIQLYLKSNDSQNIKSIHIDFDIVNISPIISSGYKEYIISGQMKIPDLLTEFSESFENLSSFDTLLKISESLKLGFSSNIELTIDNQNWINPYDTRIKFIDDIVKHMYKDDESFFEWFIDVYYNLNIIELNSIFLDKKLYKESVGFLRKNANMILQNKNNENIEKGESIIKDMPLFLSNHKSFLGTTRHILNFRLKNNSGSIFLKNGYKRYVHTYSIQEKIHISEFVSPLIDTDPDIAIQLKGRYIIENDVAVPEGIADTHVKHNWLGSYDEYPIGNTHKNYLHSKILNNQNLEEIKKIEMIIDLDSMDLTFYRGQVLPIFIFDYNKERTTEEEAKLEEEFNNLDIDAKLSLPNINKFLSGNWVINEIIYNYIQNKGMIQSIVVNKREFDSNPS
jgi:hypothetical protein